MEYLEGMLQKEKDNFGRVCNRLLGTCFLCKGNQNTRPDYYFVLKYRKEFKEYFRGYWATAWRLTRNMAWFS